MAVGLTLGSEHELLTLASNIGFTEGPVWTPDGRLFVTSVSRGLLYEVFLDGRSATAVAETGGGPNGMTLAPDGTLWITQNGGGAMPTKSLRASSPSVQAWHPLHDVDPVTVLTELFSAPSDCTFDDSGCLWFTDPNGHGFGEEALPGKVFHYNIQTCETTTVLDDVYFPNGIAFGADPGYLHIAETARDRVARYRLADGHLTLDTPDRGFEVQTPDGIAVDVEGGLWVAGSKSGKVSYFDKNGQLAKEIVVGDGTMPTSVCFAGRDLELLVITVAKGGRVLATEVAIAGLPTPRPIAPNLTRTRENTVDFNGDERR